MRYQRFENESDDELIYRICSQKEQIGTWQDVADILNDILDHDFTESAYRKSYQYFGKMLEANQDKFVDSQEQLESIREEIQTLKKEKQKLADERAALNKKLREQARLEEDLTILKDIIKDNANTTLPFNYSVPEKSLSGRDMIICLSDFHLGTNASNNFGEYNSEVAEQRLIEYLSEIKRIQKLHNCQNAIILCLGDMISGEIHFTVQLENRENLTEQVQKASELLSTFVYEISKIFNTVYVNGVAGNHSRTSFKDQVLRGNRLDNLIPWYMKAKLSHIPNIEFIDNNNIDSTIATFEIRGNKYLGVHGDWDAFSESGVSKLVMMLGYKPAAIFYGHLHHCSTDSIYDIDIIRSGGFAGTCDDYSISKRLSGKPSQMVCIVDAHGIECTYQVKLN